MAPGGPVRPGFNWSTSGTNLHARQYCLSIILCLASTPACLGGWISEVSLSERVVSDSLAGLSTIPAYVELDGLGYQSPQVDRQLLVMHAAPGVLNGLILQVVNLPPTPWVQVVTADVWPTAVLPSPLDSPDIYHLPPGGMVLTGPRTLMLFDRVTPLNAGAGKLQDNLGLLGDAVLLDALTFGPAGSAVAFDGEPVVDLDEDEVLARPALQGITLEEAPILTGVPNAFHALPITPEFRLNPAFTNRVWSGTGVPEPGSAAVWMAMAGLWAGRRRPR